MNSRKKSSRATPLLKLSAGFGGAGLIIAGLGAASTLNVIRGGTSLAVPAFLTAALGLGLAGYFIWGYGWLNKRPDLLKKADQSKVPRDLDQEIW